MLVGGSTDFARLERISQRFVHALLCLRQRTPKVPLLADHSQLRQAGGQSSCSPHAPSTHTTAEHLLTCAHLHTCDHTNIQDCFERTPVPFAEGMSQVLRMHSGEETSVEPVYLSDGTWPPNSTWAMNPIPECCKSSCSLLACTLFLLYFFIFKKGRLLMC